MTARVSAGVGTSAQFAVFAAAFVTRGSVRLNYNSLSFWLLFLAVILPYWRLDHKRQNWLLLAASYLFYGFWDYRFLFLVLISTVIDFIGGLGIAGVRLPARRLWRLGVLIVSSAGLLCTNINYPALWQSLKSQDLHGVRAALPHTLNDFAVLIATAVLTTVYFLALPWLYSRPEQQRRKLFVAISMIANLALLGFFKYCDFFIESTQRMLEAFGLGHWGGHTLGILLPAGISFYTFQAMSYTIDIYRNETEPTDDFLDFSLFVCFFPHLVAGPIMRASTLLPQVVQPRTLQPNAFGEGLYLVILGLVKKVVIADNMAPIANRVFAQYAAGGTPLTGLETLLGIYAFAFQIYGDFSGYSSVARGISKWLGFELVINFHMPYLAVSPSDFWRRWHISLSSWLRDYLYIPLGGNRGPAWFNYRNLLITMLLGGLWHGASWTFVAWGAYHGLILCLFRLLGITDPAPGGGIRQTLYWAFRVVLMFHLTCFGWLLFRADSFATVIHMSQAVVTGLVLTPRALAMCITVLFYCGLPCLMEACLNGERKLQRLPRLPSLAEGLVYSSLLVLLVVFHSEQAFEFIYFQF